MKLQLAVIFFVIIAFLGGIAFGIFIGNIYHKTTPISFKSVREKGFTYTSPLLYFEFPQENEPLIRQLKGELVAYIKNATAGNLAQNISAYIRMYTLSDWTVINEEEKYSPASLLKVPVMMEYLNESESNSKLLTTSLTYTINDSNQMSNYKPQEEMEHGVSYTIDDLLRRMIVYSDNVAEDMLVLNMQKQDFDHVFDYINIDKLNYDQQENSMEVKRYAYFFRVLYNATYLSPQNSEKALKLLTQTTFNQGIVAGLPENIPVAHKFGERKFANSGETQLHDCGLVYFPKNPYLLCIMTRGNSFPNLEKVIKNISQITYNFAKTHIGEN